MWLCANLLHGKTVFPFINNKNFIIMKRFFGIVFALCLLAAVPASAQFKFGIKAGTNLTGSPSDLEGISTDGTTGFFVGPMAKFTLPIVGLGLEGDILYSRTGVKVGGETIDKNSIEIPIYLRYDLALPVVSKVVVPFVAVGPQFGFAFGSLDEAVSNVGEYEFKKSQLSLNLGLGCVLLKHLQAHVNYNIALGTTAEYSSVLSATESALTKSKTNTWQISLAYLF